jgi:hypothetical protein
VPESFGAGAGVLGAGEGVLGAVAGVFGAGDGVLRAGEGLGERLRVVVPPPEASTSSASVPQSLANCPKKTLLPTASYTTAPRIGVCPGLTPSCHFTDSGSNRSVYGGSGLPVRHTTRLRGGTVAVLYGYVIKRMAAPSRRSTKIQNSAYERGTTLFRSKW